MKQRRRRVGYGWKYLYSLIAVINHGAIGIHMKTAGTGIRSALLILKNKKSLAADGQIQGPIGKVYTALIKLLHYGGGTHAVTGRGIGSTAKAYRINIGKFRTRLLKTRSAGVGDVIAGDFKIRGCGRQAA